VVSTLVTATAQDEDRIEVRHNERSQEGAHGRLQRPIKIAARPGSAPEQDHAAHHLEQHQGHQHWLDQLGPIPFPQRIHHRLIELVAESRARMVQQMPGKKYENDQQGRSTVRHP
jgi:hypothetical protein